MREKYLWILVVILVFGLFSLFYTPQLRPPVDNLNIQIITSFDIKPINDKNYLYEIIRGAYVFAEKNKSYINYVSATGLTIGSTREVLQVKSDKEKISGLLRASLLSDSFARHGIRNAVDIYFNDPGINDTTTFVVCKGSPLALMEYKTQGYSNAGDFIEGLVTAHKGVDFFPDEYTSKNIFARLDSEGRNITLPFIELREDGIQIAGMALFKKDKMVAALNIKDARIMNMLLYNNVKGIVTLYKNNGYVDFIAKSSRKVKCTKKGEKYYFSINLNLNGNILTNTITHSLIDSILMKEDFEKQMAENIKNQCDDFIRKMKNDYKVDCLELGRVAAANYGRRKGINWNEVVTDSNIKVNVKVNLINQGRGEF